MLYPKIDDCIQMVGDKYTLVIVAARRGRDVGATRPADLARLKTSELSFALREIAEGKVTVVRSVA